jgi:hypothetical protein
LRLGAYIYPGRSPPAISHLIPPRAFSLLSAAASAPRSLVSHCPESLDAGHFFFFRHKLASSSSSLEILDVISATPLAAMDPETSHQAATSEAARNSARSLDIESAIPKTLGGSWDPCNLDEEILSSLEQEGLIAAKEISRWRVDPGAAAPTPSKKEIVMLKSHIDRGLSLPPSYFMKSMLWNYRLQLHHITPNSFTIIAGFVALCEGFLGIYPRRDLFRLYFNICHNRDSNGDLRNYGSVSFVPRSGKSYPYIKPHNYVKGWRGSFFY